MLYVDSTTVNILIKEILHRDKLVLLKENVNFVSVYFTWLQTVLPAKFNKEKIKIILILADARGTRVNFSFSQI